MIEIKINLTKLKLNAKTETNEEIYLELENLENEIYDLSYKLEKLVFLNMTYVFVEKKNCKIENYFDSMNNNTTTGKLIIIKKKFKHHSFLISLKILEFYLFNTFLFSLDLNYDHGILFLK